MPLPRSVPAVLVASLLSAPLLVLAPVAVAAPATTEHVPGALLVRTDAGTPLSALARAASASARTLPYRRDVAELSVAPGAEEAALQALRGLPGVRWAVRDRVVRASTAPDDPGFSAQWHLQRRTAARASANWEPVHGTEATGEGTLVAVVDTGVAPDPELSSLTTGLDLVDGDTDARDENGHGTHVAGTVAQTTGNGQGVAGVAPRATLLPVRVLDAAGAGTAGQLLSGIAFAVAQGADVVNLSLGGGTADPALCESVTSAVASGSVVVAAAGNEAAPVSFPAACPGAVAVSAATQDGRLASYSNRGPEVTLAAPGGENGQDVDGDGYPDGVLQLIVEPQGRSFTFLAGTSMAAPHVAGAAALVRQLRPGLPPAQVAQVLTSTAADLGPAGRDDDFGAGLLDVAAAVASLGVALTGPGTAPDAAVPPTQTGATTDTSTEATDGTLRLAGADRYGTATAVSQDGWQGGSEVVLLASGTRFPDALAATPAAARAAAPVLLVPPCALPEVVRAELLRLSPRQVVVLGGPAAVCEAVDRAVADLTGAEVVRVAGADRYETAAALARDVPAGVDDVLLASGTDFPDALSGGVRAALGGSALLLTAPCALPPATADALRRLAPRRVTVLGGTAAVCDAAAAAAGAAAGGAQVRRLSGADRFATAAAVALDAGAGGGVAGAASGLSPADALAAGPYLALRGGPLLLVRPDSVPGPTTEALLQVRPERIVLFGGPVVVGEQVRAQLELLATGP